MDGRVIIGVVLVSDMVGSSELRTRLGEHRSDVLRRHHDELVARTLEAHGGTVLRWTGDGVKAAFPSASAAVDAGIALQRGVTEYGTSPAAVAPFRIRIGIAAGELTIEDGDHHGIAAIEAARLETLARPGELLVTDVVRALGERRSEAAFDSLGEHHLKGLDRPVVVHRVVVDTSRRELPSALLSDRRLPLVGRDAQLATLERRWAAAELGRGGLCLVRGPSGRGKSRLAAQLAEQAHAGGALVLAGRTDSELAVPYQVIADALASGLVAEEPNDGALRRLFHDPGAAPTDGQPEYARVELFDAVVTAFARLARRRPTLVVLDDVHWATPSTIRLLGHLAAGLAEERVLLLVTTRPDETAPARFELNALACALAADDLVDLPALDERDVASLLSVVRPEADAQRMGTLARVVHRESAGNPFFAVELLHHLDATGQLDATAVDDHPVTVPDTVHLAVTQRISRLGAGIEDTLRVAAVIGAEFDVDVLAAATGHDADDVLDRLDAARRDGLVNETTIDGFAFTHAIIRTALLQDWSPTRRARAHRRVAEAIEAIEAIEQTGASAFDELAHHWQQAGMNDRAIVHLAQAAHRDLVALDYESSRRRYEHVLELLEHDPSIDVRTRARVLLGHGAACRALGDASYTSSIAKAGRLAWGVRDAELLGEAAVLSLWPGTYFFVANEHDRELVGLCEHALEMIDASSPIRVRVLAALAAHLTFADAGDRMSQLLEEARALADHHGDPALLADVLSAEFLCIWDPSTAIRRQRIARELGRIARLTGDPGTEFLARFYGAYCRAELGDVVRARQELDDVLPIAVATTNGYYVFLAERLALSIDVLLGAPDVQPRIDELHQRFAETHADTSGTWALQTGAVAVQRGTFASMLNAIEAMAAGPHASTWTAGIALARMWAGDHDGAQAILAATTEHPRNYFWITVAQVYGEVAAGIGDLGHCERLYAELQPFRGRIGITASGSLCWGLVTRTLGLLASAIGRHEEAEELLTEAVEQADTIGARHESVLARRQLAEAVLAADRGADVTELVEQARELAKRDEFPRELELLDRIAFGT